MSSVSSLSLNREFVNLTELQNLTKILIDFDKRLEAAEYNNDSFFLVCMAVVIFLMQCGFGFLEAGSVRSKNTTNILIKNLLDSCISAICYWATGWAFAYGEPSNPFCGGGHFLLIGFPTNLYPKFFFQFVFTATASTIVSGALAERCEFLAYFAYCAILTLFVYPVVSHWAWAGDGWLANGPMDVTFKDFAGSGVVHVLGGACAFVGALILGPRIGRFETKDHPKTKLLGHSVPFAAMGGFLLMFGFFAFNGGSQASITQKGDGEVVARAMSNTMLSGGWAAVTALGINRILGEKWSLLFSINGALTGMVSACAGCDVLEPWAACLVGVGAGISYVLVAATVVKLKVDDPLDAVGGRSCYTTSIPVIYDVQYVQKFEFLVHFGGGFWGLIATPFLMNGGIFYVWTLKSFVQLGWNILGGLVIAIWSAFWLGLTFFIMRLLKLLRVDEEIEIRGLDIYKHGEAAYPLAAYGHGWEEPGLPPSATGSPQNGTKTHVRAEVALEQMASNPHGMRKRSIYETPELQAMNKGQNRFNWFKRHNINDLKSVEEHQEETKT